MYAVVEDRNQQFRAAIGQRVRIPLREDLEPGSQVTFDKVCLVTGEAAAVGTPYVDGASVTAKVLGRVQGRKLFIQKFKRRKNMRRRTGFRPRFTEIVVEGITVEGKELGVA